MKTINLTSKTEITISAPVNLVWSCLTDPPKLKKFLLNLDVASDFTEGGQIRFKGTLDGKPFNAIGTILQLKEKEKLQFNYFNTLSVKPDIIDNYTIVTFDLKWQENEVIVELSKDNNESEEIVIASQKNLEKILADLKTFIETV